MTRCQRKHNVQKTVTILFYHRESSLGHILSRSHPSWCMKFLFKFTSSLQKGKHRWWLGVEIVSFSFYQWISFYSFFLSWKECRHTHRYMRIKSTQTKTSLRLFYLAITNELKYHCFTEWFNKRWVKVKNDIPLTTPVKTPFPLLGTNLKGLFSLSFRHKNSPKVYKQRKTSRNTNLRKWRWDVWLVVV